MTTIGSSVSPNTMEELMLIIVVSTTAFVIFAWSLALVSELRNTMNHAKHQYLDQARVLNTFARTTGLSGPLVQSLRATLLENQRKEAWGTDSKNAQEATGFFVQMPEELTVEMVMEMFGQRVGGHPFFREMLQHEPPELAVRLATRLESRLYPMKVYFYRADDHPRHMYFLVMGRACKYSRIAKEAIDAIEGGQHFGEVEILERSARVYTVRAEMDCEALRLGKEAMLEAFEEYPEFEEGLIDKARETLVTEQAREREILHSTGTDTGSEAPSSVGRAVLRRRMRATSYASDVDSVAGSFASSYTRMSSRKKKLQRGKRNRGSDHSSVSEAGHDVMARVESLAQKLSSIEGKIVDTFDIEDRLIELEDRLSKLDSLPAAVGQLVSYVQKRQSA